MFWTIVGLIVVAVLLMAWVSDRRRRDVRRIALNDSQDSRSGAYRDPFPRDFGGVG